MNTMKSNLMPGIKAIIVLVVLSFLFASGCTTSTGKNYSGFLKDYSKLQADPEFEGTMISLDSNETLKNYDQFIIDPVTFYLSPEVKAEAKDIDPELIYAATTYFRSAVISELKKTYNVVEKPGKGVVRLRIAITGVEINRKDLKLYNLIPVSLVITAVGEATGVRDSLAVMNMEGEALDSLTGRRIALVVQEKAHEVSAKNQVDLKAQEIFPLLDYWALKLKRKIDQIQGN
jgi:hypothetical protein